ncbi:hypothetical protein A3E39_02285 [Candidatus Uhrbacteria bacterium RIFCSPHIGHO2_12_FULL_60_25]|uniref:Uncharacterized protein n=1 Tax=Candidatus Uhrbacteria bacterium RIFCSPHIGHO2_12_FULL_60_25 TaxID=1802399 RepID=A0A1F7ULA7_9BACT|nr:MAG: hypothetical protein A3D73_03665 [Candidatus Uhrbacteria bacterium RIFCSPHIGHO2_02_FULL_60_44]OGL79051.1 MAG: hypothetical protein A3E39_02285 [Candidatus Uhrbacteria bacterium RIFCSPHIGHO2_12_FULL_60_25]
MPRTHGATTLDELTAIRTLLAPAISCLSRKHQAGFNRLYVLAANGHSHAAIGSANGSEKNGMVNRPLVVPSQKKSSASAKKSTQTTDRRRDAREAEVIVKDGIRMELLRAKADGEKKHAAKRDEIIKRLRIPASKNKVSVIGAIMAYTAGKFRPEFVARMVLRQPAGKPRVMMLRELATLLDSNFNALREQVKNSRTFKDNDN